MSPKKLNEESSLRDAIKQKRGERAIAQPPTEPTKPVKDDKWSNYTRIKVMGPGLKQVTLFCHQLSTLLNVGISLQRGLQILHQRTHHPQLREVIGEVSKSIDEGKSFSTALAEHPSVFPPLIVNVVKIGESGGILESSLARLSEILYSKLAIRRKIIAASTYPMIVLLVMILVISVVLIVAVPRFAEILQAESTTELPWITTFIIGLGSFFETYWSALFFAAFVTVVVGWWHMKTPTGARFWEGVGYLIPKFRNLPVNINIARSTRSLGGLLAAGIPLLEALQVTAESSESHKMRDALNRVYLSLETGGKFETPLRCEEHIFPPIVTDMIAVGEEAGALDTMLLSIADNADSEVEAGLDTLQSTIEPVLILLMGVSVLFVFLALFLPYFSLISAVGA